MAKVQRWRLTVIGDVPTLSCYSVTQTDTEDLYIIRKGRMSIATYRFKLIREELTVTTHGTGIRRGDGNFRRLVSRRNFYFHFHLLFCLFVCLFYLIVMFLLSMSSSLSTDSFRGFSDVPYWSMHFKSGSLLCDRMRIRSRISKFSILLRYKFINHQARTLSVALLLQFDDKWWFLPLKPIQIESINIVYIIRSYNCQWYDLFKTFIILFSNMSGTSSDRADLNTLYYLDIDYKCTVK